MTRFSIRRKIYVNSKTNETWLKGDMIQNPELADTLEKLASSSDFAIEFSEGEVGQNLTGMLQKIGGILTIEDLKNYKPLWKSPTNWTMQNTYKAYSTSEYNDCGGLY